MSFNSLQTTSGSISWQTAANWSLLLAPTTSQNVTVAASSATFDTGLNNTATLSSLSVPMTFTGTAGLAPQIVKSVSGITRTSTTATATSTAHGYENGDTVLVSGAVETDYNGTFTIFNKTTDTFDYTVSGSPSTPATGTILVKRRAHLIQPVTSAIFGTPSNNSSIAGQGTGRWAQDFGSVQTTITVLNTSTSSTDTSLEPLRIIGTHASNVLNMNGGLVGIATGATSEVATFATINQTGGALNCGVGLTWTSIYQSGGTMRLASGAAAGTITQDAGTCELQHGTGTIGTINVGDLVLLNTRAASGTTVTNLNLADGSVLDLTNNPANISVTTITVTGKAKIKTNPANPGHLSWTTLTRNAGGEVSFE